MSHSICSTLSQNVAATKNEAGYVNCGFGGKRRGPFYLDLLFSDADESASLQKGVRFCKVLFLLILA